MIKEATPKKVAFVSKPYTQEERIKKAKWLMEKVDLKAEQLARYPHEFSGGQRQRISLARAIILEPQVIILDEALAALDPSLRAQMINLLLDLQQQMGLAYILITHNLGIVRHFSDNIMVLSHGNIVEEGKTTQVMRSPKHKVTQKLMMSQNLHLKK